MHLRTILSTSLCVCMLGASVSEAYRLNDRWNATATNGGGLGQGDPTTITYSIVPNGTNIPGEGPSDLVTMLDNEFGSSATWLPLIQQSFDRWDELSGLTTVYESNDDGVSLSNANSGILGVRGDVRIGGAFLDGNSGVLAYNYFPDYGDMVLDTGDGNFYDGPSGNFRALRNVIMHEHGHGLGMSHVESSNSSQLMEPFINLSFDGPQFDDLLAVQRGYGDIYEENGGNNTAPNATPFGTVADGATVSIGTDARNNTAVINQLWDDFVSVDDNSDFDYYSFTVTSTADLDITLDPRGPTYNEGPQNGSQSSYNTRALSNLRLRLYDTNGTTLLQDQNATGAGSAESINGFNVAAGTYYVRVSGQQNNVQMYQLDITANHSALLGDFDDNGDYACADIDDLVFAVANGSTSSEWDMNGDTLVNHDDVLEWLAIAGAAENASGNPYLEGDMDLSGTVDASDFAIWAMNKFTNTAAWCSGDLNSSGTVDAVDFSIWSNFKFQSSFTLGDGGFTAAVPEPSALLLFGLAALALGARRSR